MNATTALRPAHERTDHARTVLAGDRFTMPGSPDTEYRVEYVPGDNWPGMVTFDATPTQRTAGHGTTTWTIPAATLIEFTKRTFVGAVTCTACGVKIGTQIIDVAREAPATATCDDCAA